MKKRYTEEQVIGSLREANAGGPIVELCRRHGFSEASFYLWCNKFGVMSVSDAKRLKQLLVNACLRTKSSKRHCKKVVAVSVKAMCMAPSACNQLCTLEASAAGWFVMKYIGKKNPHLRGF